MELYRAQFIFSSPCTKRFTKFFQNHLDFIVSNIYNKIDLVKILLNRTACLIKLTQYDNTFIEFERILSILSKQKAIADIQSNIILSEEVKRLEFSTLAKRAYVYSINNKIEEAIKDYNRALELKPGDIKIKAYLLIIFPKPLI